MLQNILDISFVADESNVLNIQIVADGTLTKNPTRRRPVIGSLSAFPVWDILRHVAHACAPAILDAVSLTSAWNLDAGDCH